MGVLFGVRGGVLAASMMMGWFAVGVAPRPVAAQSIAVRIAASEDLLDINTATEVQLRALPGMGDAYVKRIVAGRPYSAKNQLTMRGILPAGAYEEIKGLIIAHRVKSSSGPTSSARSR